MAGGWRWGELDGGERPCESSGRLPPTIDRDNPPTGGFFHPPRHESLTPRASHPGGKQTPHDENCLLEAKRRLHAHPDPYFALP
jgi:hypothetical protein